MHVRKLLIINDGGGKQRDSVPSAGTESCIQKSGIFVLIRVYSANTVCLRLYKLFICCLFVCFTGVTTHCGCISQPGSGL
jgi:hypothetical protein